MKTLAEYPTLENTTPEEALDNLPSIFQAVGTLNAKIRCKAGSKRQIELTKIGEKLDAQGAACSSIIRFALRAK